MLRLLAIVSTFGLLGPAVGASAAQHSTRNVLLLILDDVPLNAVSCYPGAVASANTPRLDGLAANGVRFSTVWANPSCSPTRATIMTGRYAFRTGVGSVIRQEGKDPGLQLSELCLPELIRQRVPSAHTAFLGKWHLGGVGHGPDHPREQGFAYFRGTLGNLGGKGTAERYFNYREFLNGVEGRREAYATTAVTDDAIAAVERFSDKDGDAPWLVVASYHAAHTPYHAPPAELHTRQYNGTPGSTDVRHFPAMVEALDTEIGRLLDSLSDEVRVSTVVVVVGDNGGASSARQGKDGLNGGPGKGSLRESGVRVPLIVAGATVVQPGRTSDALVNTTDLFDSIVEWTTGNAPEETPDSVSIAPYLADPKAPSRRTWLFADRFRRGRPGDPPLISSRYAIRGRRYKLIEDETRGLLRFCDLESDQGERVSLLHSGKMDEEAIAELARFTVLMAGDLGDDRAAGLGRIR